MSYEVVYSAKARQDLRDVYKYIAEELLVPETAKVQTDRIMKVIRSLEEMPMRHRLYEEEPWHSQGLRVLPVDNYIVFYFQILKVIEKRLNGQTAKFIVNVLKLINLLMLKMCNR